MLGIIILNYNSWELVIDCVNSIKGTIDNNKIEYKIYIIDNGSQNDSYEELIYKYSGDSSCLVKSTGKNLGFSGGNNYGSKIAVEDGCDYLLITNSDVIFTEKSICNMYNALKEKQSALVYPFVMNKDGTVQCKECMIGTRDVFYDFFVLRDKINRVLPMNIKKKYFINVENIKNPINSTMYFGCCYMVDVKKYTDVDMLDENVFLYYEENILSTKYLNKGYNMTFVPNAKIFHLCGASSNSEKTKRYVKKSRYYYLRYYKKYNKLLCYIDSKI